MIVLHGDHAVASRQALLDQVESAKKHGLTDIIWLNGQKLTITDLIQALESHSLLGSDRLVIIENLHKRLQSQAKKRLLSYLGSIETATQVILWESKPLTKTQLKTLGNPQAKLFKIPQTIFTFLDSLRPNNPRQSLTLLHQTTQQNAPELVFSLLVRQVRLMIQVKDRASTKLPPWQKGKLSRQAASFTSNQLLLLHRHLLEIDTQIKTGTSLGDLSGSLDLLLATL